jgi:D-alanyl-D-alanine carboxypeptidase
MCKFIFAAIVLTLTSAASPVVAQERSDLSMPLEAILKDFQDRYAFPGATAAIPLPDGYVATAAVGLEAALARLATEAAR